MKNKKNKKIKQKTRKSVSKRFKLTKTGKLLFRGSHSRHLRRKKSKNQIRRQKKTKIMTGRRAKKFKKVIGK